MKFLFDFFPILAFFIAFKITGNSETGIYTATAVLMIASFIQITVYWLMYRRFENMHLITLGVVLLFGGATLLLHDERFIQWKPTVVLWIFALVALGSQYIGNKNIFQRMIHYSDERITAPDIIWFRLNISLVVFFILLGIANIYVAFNFDRAFWVDFKVFGITILNLIFMGGAMVYMFRHADIPEDMLPKDENKLNDINHEINQENK
ncbi:MAG: septation protein A [Gammaproteobacteria bacterium]